MIGVTMGMAIVDDNEFWDGRQGETNVLGGAGPYFIAGAAIIAGERQRSQYGGIIDVGDDFPPLELAKVKRWGAGIRFRREDGRLTTRGVNYYDSRGVRHFRYTTEKRQIFSEDLVDQGLIDSEWFHLICSSERAEQFIQELSAANGNAKFIYEPLPSDCIVSKFTAMKRLVGKVDVFSPNLEEARQLCGVDTVEEIVQLLSDNGDDNSLIVVRCGADGAYIYDGSITHIPAFTRDQSKVVDVTGGGNSFCGGFVAGYHASGDWISAGVAGNLASSYIIEETGLPLDLHRDCQVRLDHYLNRQGIEIVNFLIPK